MRRAVRFAPALALMGAIFFLSSRPNLSSGIEGWDFLLRKLGHMAIFGGLFLALLYALPGRPREVAVLAVLYAASDEWHQSFVDGRHGTPTDVLIDTVGVLLAWGLVRRRRRTRSAASSTDRCRSGAAS